MKTWDVSIVGELYVDHILSGFQAWPGPGEEVFARDYVREIGGGAANTACGLSRLGRSVNLVGVIGRDDAGWFERRLAEFGLDAAGLQRTDGPTGLTLSVSTREDRSFFTHWGANRHLAEILLSPATLASLAVSRHVHFAMPLSPPQARRILPALAAAGVATTLDVGYQPAWLADAGNYPTLRAVDHLLPNEKEAALLSGAEGPDPFFAFARAEALRSPLLKRGALGAMGQTQGARIEVAPPPVDAVDTTGAGDAFDAGFIDALIDGADLEESLRRACICGALSTRAPGALAGLPDRAELRSVHDQTYRS